MVAIGLVMSAGGGRLTIFGILDSAEVYDGERILSLYRWRRYRYLRIENA